MTGFFNKKSCARLFKYWCFISMTFLWQSTIKKYVVKTNGLRIHTRGQMLGCGAHVRIIALPHVRCACGSTCEKHFEMCVRCVCVQLVFCCAMYDRTFAHFLTRFSVFSTFRIFLSCFIIPFPVLERPFPVFEHPFLFLTRIMNNYM